MDTSQLVALLGGLTGAIGLAVSILTALSSVRRGAFQNLSEDYKRLNADNDKMRSELDELMEQTARWKSGIELLIKSHSDNDIPIPWTPGADPAAAWEAYMAARAQCSHDNDNGQAQW